MEADQASAGESEAGIELTLPGAASPAAAESLSGGAKDVSTIGAGEPLAGGAPAPSGDHSPSKNSGAPDADEPHVNYAMGGTSCCGVRWATEGHHLMPYNPQVYRDDWKQLLRETLAGITVAFAQVSDSIAFAFIAGVGPLLGLHAAWIIGFTMSLIGSRPGMINGATGVRAAVLAPYVAQLGVGYLFYIVVAISIFQFVASFFSLAKLVRLVTRPVMIGFVCGLAVIMAMGQIPAFYVPRTTTFNDSTTIWWQVFIIVFSLLAMVAWPYVPVVGKSLPPPLIGIFFAMALEFGIVRAAAGHKTPVVADLGKVSGGFPLFFWVDPQYSDVVPPLTLEVVVAVLQPAFVAAAAGMVEAVMTMEVANDMTETDNPAPDQQLLALGIGNLLCGLLGTMGGGATIGPTVIACSNGANGRYRISGIVAAVVLLLVILVASDVVAIIPTSALVAVMAVVCWATFEWSMPGMVLASALPRTARNYIGLHRKVRRMDALVMVVVTLVTIFADLFTAVIVGIGVSAVDFSWQQAQEVSVFSSLVPMEEGDRALLLAESGDEAEGDTEAEGGGQPDEAEAAGQSGESAPGASADAEEAAPGAGGGAEAGAKAKDHDEAGADAKAALDTAHDGAPRSARVAAILRAEGDAADSGSITGRDSDGSRAGTPSERPLVKRGAGVAVDVSPLEAGSGDGEGSDAPSVQSGALDEDEEAALPPGSAGPVKRVYVVTGCVFFASAMDFVKRFGPEVIKADPALVEFRFDDAAIGDYSGMHAVATVAEKYAAAGKKVVVRRLGVKSFKLVSKADHLIEHFEYRAADGGADEAAAAGNDDDAESQVRSRSGYKIREGAVAPPEQMHIRATQPHLRS